jgi:hypothetical protein
MQPLTEGEGKTMASERVADMTIQELKALIDRKIEDRLRPGSDQRRDRPMEEVWESMLKNMIEPGPDEPSVLDMLREERNQWYSRS